MSDNQETQTQEVQVQQVQVAPVPEKKVRVKRNLTDEQRQKLSTRAKESSWGLHIAEFRKANPDVKGREVYRKAKETYTKKSAAPAKSE